VGLVCDHPHRVCQLVGGLPQRLVLGDAASNYSSSHCPIVDTFLVCGSGQEVHMRFKTASD
jgi:hypothetical protein